VIVTVPAATPVITPEDALTVAIPVFAEVHVPPASPSVVKVVVPPTQIAWFPFNVPEFGAAVMLTLAETGFEEQPAELVTTTE
jgi:hypothetical protein